MSENEGELKKRITKKEYDGTEISEIGIIVIESKDVFRILNDAKKEFEGILSANMPDFQKLLAISAFKNKQFGEK